MKTVAKQRSLAAVMLIAIGVVYGDIGTSPLYTLRECFSSRYGFSVNQNTVYGFLSLIFWMQIFIVSLKYLAFVMRADNAGEGGILTLMSLARRYTTPRVTALLMVLGLVGGSFFYGEVVITPAISVLSAIEGLEIIAPELDAFVIPIALVVLTLLFFIQKKGSGSIGNLFGPIMVVWFLTLGILGLKSILATPEIWHALNPVWAVEFFIQYKSLAFLALGAAVLSITGVEALYADIGYFGKFPIRLSWFTLILPALMLNYFGQGALLLRNPEAVQNPFFLLAPQWALIPLLILATLATIIASQAVVSGVFTLTHQAVRQGFMPPMRIIYTSEQEGQIYIPNVNWTLYVAVVIVILLFERSGNLASAYGIAVTGTMILTTILVCVVAYKNWYWSLSPVLVLLVGLLCMDIPLFAANALKFTSGGWLPILLGLIVLIIMLTWKTERTNLFRKLHERSNSLEAMIASLEKTPPVRVPGTAVYMTRATNVIPFALTHNLKHNKVLHDRVIFLTIRTANIPRVHKIRRVQVEQLSKTFWRVIASYGFKETPNLEDVFLRCAQEGLTCRLMETSFFLSHESLFLGPRRWYRRLKGKVFIALSRNSLRAADQFQIPPNRVVELGTQVEI